MPEQPDQRLDYRRAITELREKRRMSREALAEAAGISASYLYEVERGLKRPSADVLAKLAGALGMLPSQMMEYVERQVPLPSLQRPFRFFSMASPASRREAAAKQEHADLQPTDVRSMAAATPQRPALEDLLSIAQELDDEDVHLLLEFARRLRNRKP